VAHGHVDFVALTGELVSTAKALSGPYSRMDFPNLRQRLKNCVDKDGM